MMTMQAERPDFGSLLDSYGGEIFAFLWRILQNQQDAEDCLQETFLRGYRAYERTRVDSNYRAWLYKIATNVARSYLKKRNRFEHFGDEVLLETSIDPLEAMSHSEQRKHVLREVEQLPFNQRTAILLRKYSGLEYKLIAETLDCSPAAARANVYQGLKRLRDRLNPEGSRDE
jgi:RNA polymerase sigma-70 factor (ECF subfamily)